MIDNEWMAIGMLEGIIESLLKRHPDEISQKVYDDTMKEIKQFREEKYGTKSS